MLKKKIACVATILALCGTFMVGAEYTILEKTEKVETTVYGSTQTGSLTERINNLDKTLNGVPATNTGSVESRTDSLFNNVYGHTGDDLSMLAAVNMMQWKYSGIVTHDSLNNRVSTLEQDIYGKPNTGSLRSRVAGLRSTLLGNTKFVSEAVTVPAGTIVRLKTQEPISTATNKAKDALHFNVLEDVMVGGVIAIPRGAECDGTISSIRHATRFGRDGKLTITFGNVLAANGTPIALTVGTKTKDEYKRLGYAAGASTAGALILGPVGLVGGLFVKGHDVVMPAGSTVLAETKANSDVVGFSQTTPIADNRSADAAATGVNVTAGATPADATTPSAADVAAPPADTTAASTTAAPAATAPATTGSYDTEQEAPAATANANTTQLASAKQTADGMQVGEQRSKVTGVDLSKSDEKTDTSAVVTISSNK